MPRVLLHYEGTLWKAYHSRLGIVLSTDDPLELTRALNQARVEARRHGIRDFDGLLFRKSPDNTELWIIKAYAKNSTKPPESVNPALPR